MNAVIKAAHIKEDIGTGLREAMKGSGRKLSIFFNKSYFFFIFLHCQCPIITYTLNRKKVFLLVPF